MLGSLTHKHRTDAKNLALGRILSFIAGGINAGGFLLVGDYTSHMTGLVAKSADVIALGRAHLAWSLLGLVAVFIMGAVFTTVCVLWAQKRELHSQYALPLLIEALLLGFLCLAATTDVLPTGQALHWQSLLLCFVMGLQNAAMTKASNAVVRTTHLTGMITDMGICMGRLIYHRNNLLLLQEAGQRLWMLSSLVGLFFVGGIVGGMAFTHMGFYALLPCAVLLFGLALPPLWLDIRKDASVL